MELAAMDGRNAKHHLDVLEKTGVISSYMDGRKKYYRLVAEIRLDVSPPPEGKFILYMSNPRIGSIEG
jgi:DNA-binding transcriptional ArsR family regulator